MITRQQIALIQLSSLGLISDPPPKPKKTDLLECLKQIGILQIDTINVVNRSPYLVLWSRLGNYDPSWLEQIHKDGHLFEYWAHANCFIPVEDYPLFRRFMLERATHWWNVNEWVTNHQDVIQYVKNTIKDKGPKRSSDFPKRSSGSNGWWDWKEEKIALDMLWTLGDLMIPYRKNFQRYYDLKERVIESQDDKEIPDIETVNKILIEKTIKLLGAARPKWIADYYRRKQTEVTSAIESLQNEQKVNLISSGDFSEGIFVHSENLPLLNKVLNGEIEATRTTILSPFDPLIWDRIRTKELFNFDYSLECYLPATKRVYGYFCLPILYNGQLVGRMDTKAHRKEKITEIKNIYFEPWFSPNDHFFQNFSSALHQFSTWHHANEIHYPAAIDPKFSKLKDYVNQ